MIAIRVRRLRYFPVPVPVVELLLANFHMQNGAAISRISRVGIAEGKADGDQHSDGGTTERENRRRGSGRWVGEERRNEPRGRVSLSYIFSGWKRRSRLSPWGRLELKKWNKHANAGHFPSLSLRAECKCADLRLGTVSRGGGGRRGPAGRRRTGWSGIFKRYPSAR